MSEIGCFHEAFEPLIVQLVELGRARDDAFARFIEQPVVPGSKGQDRTNPSAELSLKLSDRCLRLADQLLLTPRARRRAGIRHVAVDDDFFRELDAYGQGVDDN